LINKTWQTQRSDKKNLTMDKEASKKNRPFLCRNFRKEVNILARKAGKKRVLGLYAAAALKHKQDRESKAKGGKGSQDQSRRFLAVKIFHFCEQHGKTYPLQECPQV
jgi:hypothetical protein